MEKEEPVTPYRPHESNLARTPLHDQFDAAKPVYPDNQSSVDALRAQLKHLAERMEMSVDELLGHAHGAMDFQTQYRAALNLERQLCFLKS